MHVALTWPKLIIIGFYAVSLVSTILIIGKPRSPITPVSALFSLIVITGMVALILIA